MKVLLEPVSSASNGNIEFKKAKTRLNIVIVTWIIIGIMIPVWWHFVKVYRSPLPYAEIDYLLNVLRN